MFVRSFVCFSSKGTRRIDPVSQLVSRANSKVLGTGLRITAGGARGLGLGAEGVKALSAEPSGRVGWL